jgi:hypothetical protein
MAFDKSALTTYVVPDNIAKELSIKAVNSAKTAKLLVSNGSVIAGVKGTARINKLDSDVAFQDGANCSARVASGSTVLTDADFPVKRIKDIQNFCAAALDNTYYSMMLAKGQSPEGETIDASLMNEIMNLRALKVASGIESLLWNGDTALTGNSTLKWFDGFRKQIKAGSYVNVSPEGTILTKGSITGGSSYTNGTYTAVALTGGSGTGATATIVVGSNAVTTVTIVSGGFGYKVGDVLSATAASIGGTGTGFSVPVATVSTSASIIAQLQGVYSKTPIQIRKAEDHRIFLGEDFYDQYLIALDNANKYREASAFNLTGTTAKLEPVPGLNGTSEVYSARISDIYMGTDGTDDADRAELRWSMEVQQWYMDFYFALGAKAVNIDQIGYANFS